ELPRCHVSLSPVAVHAGCGEVVEVVRSAPRERDTVVHFPCAAVPVAAIVRPCELLVAISAVTEALFEYVSELLVAIPHGALPPLLASAAAPRMRPPRMAAPTSPFTSCFRRSRSS